MNKYLIAFLSFLCALSAAAEERMLSRFFLQQGLKGTIVISSLNGEQTFIHNDSRAEERFPAASTFKILNTLIALEEKVISSKSEVLKWDGHIYDFTDWNHDQTLESAFKVSCAWCFQELAGKVGAVNYRSYVKKSSYGELREPFDEKTFWLDGALKISAIEQVNFLKKLYQRTLPFSANSYEILRQIMLVEQAPSHTMWAKTGWATSVNPQVGWYVGYLETPKDIWFFAMNIEVRGKNDLRLRQQLTRDSLQAMGVIK